MGTVFGPVIGAMALLVLEEVLLGGPLTGCLRGRCILGPMLLLVVLFARGGIDGLLARCAWSPWLMRCSRSTA